MSATAAASRSEHSRTTAGYFVEAGHLGGPPAPLPGDDLEAPGPGRAHHDRLDDAARPHRVRELFESGLLHDSARLVLARGG